MYNGIMYSSKKEAVLTVKPDANLKSGVYVTYLDTEARQNYLEKTRTHMRRKYQEDPEYRELHKQKCRERYQNKKMSKTEVTW